MATTTRPRPRSLPSTTTKLSTEMGNLYVTVSTDEDGEPFEVFGWLGKGGSFQHGVTELACRLISLHLRRGTPLEEVIDQCQGIAEMQPFFNQMPDGKSVAVLGLGDGIAHILNGNLAYLRDQVYCAYRPEAVEPRSLTGMFGAKQEIGLRDQNRFLYLVPTEDERILPFVTLHSDDKWRHFKVYVLLSMLDEKSRLKALVMRFETDEGDRNPSGKIGSHDFCHAQFCESINGIIQASTPSWMPTSQPSIPLDADNQISLVLCMLVSVYGGAFVKSRIDSAGIGGIQKHLDKVRALSG